MRMKTKRHDRASASIDGPFRDTALSSITVQSAKLVRHLFGSDEDGQHRSFGKSIGSLHTASAFSRISFPMRVSIAKMARQHASANLHRPHAPRARQIAQPLLRRSIAPLPTAPYSSRNLLIAVYGTDAPSNFRRAYRRRINHRSSLGYAADRFCSHVNAARPRLWASKVVTRTSSPRGSLCIPQRSP